MNKLKALASLVRVWLGGKKTYLLAGLICLAVLAMVFLGRLTPETGLAVALFALAGFAATFRSALANNQAQVISVLADVGALGLAVRNRNRPSELVAAAAAAEDGAKLAEGLAKGAAN